jgi:hypothetical protein
MPVYLLTVAECHVNHRGLRVQPGIRPDDVGERPGVARLARGARLALLRPDGTTRLTRLVTYALPVERDEPDLYIQDAPRDPELCLILNEQLVPGDVPSGTEVWMLDAPAA